MKKLSLFLFIFLSASSYAQFIQDIGIKSGLTLSDQEWEISSHRQETFQRQGIYLGLTANFLQGPYFQIATDIGYAQKGSISKWAYTDENNPEGGSGKFIDIDSRFDYLTFTPAAKAKYPLGNFNPYFLAGPRVDILLGYSGLFEDSPRSYFNDVTFGITAGIGLDYKIGPMAILLEGQYQPDLTPLRTTKASGNQLASTLKNNALLILLGVKYLIN